MNLRLLSVRFKLERVISSYPRVLQTFVVLAAVFGVYRLASSASQGWIILLWIGFTAYFFFCVTSSFHETAHSSMRTSVRASSKLIRGYDLLVGNFLGTAMGVSFTAYLETHFRHHQNLNSPGDWELWPYACSGVSLPVRRIFVWVDLIFGFLTSPWIYSRISWSGSSPLAPQVRRKILTEYLWMILIWSLILYKIHLNSAWIVFLRAWILPLFLAGFLQTGRKFTEHLGMGSLDPLLGTRTVLPETPISRFFCFLNFNIFVHGVHHNFRHSSAHKAEAKEGRIPPDKGNENFFPSYSKAIMAMLPHFLRNPGIGINSRSEVQKIFN